MSKRVRLSSVAFIVLLPIMLLLLTGDWRIVREFSIFPIAIGYLTWLVTGVSSRQQVAAATLQEPPITRQVLQSLSIEELRDLIEVPELYEFEGVDLQAAQSILADRLKQNRD